MLEFMKTTTDQIHLLLMDPNAAVLILGITVLALLLIWGYGRMLR